MLRRTTRLTSLAALAVLAITATAQARQMQQYFYSGQSIVAGGSSPAAIAVNGAAETLLAVGTGDKGFGLKISRFDLDGNPVGFPGRQGATSFHTEEPFSTAPRVAIATDESGTASEGNFYVAADRDGAQRVYGYAADGTALSGFPFSQPGACGLAVAPDGHLWVASSTLGSYSEFSSAAKPTGRSLFVGAALETGKGVCRIAIDSASNFYVAKGDRMAKYDANRQFLSDLGPGEPLGFSERGAPLLAFDRGDGTLFELFGAAVNDPLVQVDSTGDPIEAFGAPDPAHSYGGLGNPADLAVDPQTHDVYVLSQGQVDVFERDPSPVTVPSVSVQGFEDLTGTAATLVGSVDPDGPATTDCHFEWGMGGGERTPKYNKVAPCAEGDVFSGENVVTAAISGLEKGTTYNFRLSSENANGIVSFTANRELNAADVPVLGEATIDHITTEAALVHLAVNPNGDNTRYHVEVGTDTNYGTDFPVPDASIARKRALAPEGFEIILSPVSRTQEITGLEPATQYHYRVVTENAAGVTEGDDHVFRTFALPSVSEEGCPNTQARQQTSSGELLDCRGYELVSAPDTGGYDVRSGLSPGVDAIPTSPDAPDAALYSMRSGTIPGIAGHPTNRGADPYIATRSSDGWSTRYVGLASNNPFATGPFASSLSGFDDALKSFSFGGEEICDPCFADGSTDVPLRQGSSDISQGMAGSLDPSGPANSTGIVKKPLSPDGSHLVFETTSQFEPEGNSNGTDATIYSRDLKANTTEVVSTDENGDAIQAGEELAELDISKDGSRTLFGEELSSDAEGNRYYHLYLHIAGTEESVDLMPGATEGALYGGMTEDGTKAFFTTAEPLAAGETDESVDAYAAEVPGPGAVTPQILSWGSGGTGDTDSCSPPGDPNNWNAVSGEGKCNVLAFAGGAGVASQAGDFYLLSPELLDGANGTQDQANLYLVEGGSTTPQFVTTIDSSLVKVPPPPNFVRITDSFGGSRGEFAFFNGAIAVDSSSGHVYVAEGGEFQLQRYTSSGAPANFTAGPGAGTNVLPGLELTGSSSTVAFDNSGGPFDGSLYVSAPYATISLYSTTGAQIGELNGSGTPQGYMEPCGVAVDQSDGTVYVAEEFGTIWRYEPTAPATLPASDADYAVTGVNTGMSPCILAADDGKVYASENPGPAKVFPASAFAETPPNAPGTVIDPSSRGLAVDAETHELYVSKFTEVAVYSPSGKLVKSFGTGQLSKSSGLAVNSSSKHVYVSEIFPAKVNEFGPVPAPFEPIDNPAITHATNQAGTHDPSDFQVTPDGRYAAFASVMPLDGYDSGGRYQVFRSERGGSPQCLSCAQSLAIPSSDASLTPYGLSLLSDGRVFFNTGEQLTLRDSNEKRDAYEWSDGKQELISTGTSPSDSELLSASADGKDVFFFTRQKLVPQDQNGDNVRLYDAREGGGFEFGPPQFQCAASDECHGASTKAPAPLGAATTAGTPGQFQEGAKPGKCAKGKVRRRGRCVKRKPRKHAHKRTHKRAAKANRGGGK